jgi:3-oxoacyl-[acyl-carrier protein] reductase
MTAAIVSSMERGSKIINIGSGMGHSSGNSNSSYRVGKAGAWMLTQCMAEEFWEQGIEVNELVPGPVITDATKDVFEVGGAPPFAASERVKTPEEVAPLALWLASQKLGGPTGQSFSLARRPL